MDAERFEYVEKSEQTECDGKNPRMGDDGFCRNECEAHENPANFVDDNPAGVFGAGVFHCFFHKWDGCEKDDEGCGYEEKVYKNSPMKAMTGK